MARPGSLPSLTSSLLARKGTARPAMRQQDLDAPAADVVDDLGWNDMGGPQPQVLVEREALKVEIERPVATVSKASRIGRGASAKPRRAKANGAKAAFTLRLDTDRHRRLRLAGAVTGRSSQQLVTQALDAFLLTIPEVDARVAHLPPATSKR